jgi:hypothetical protein
MKPGNAQHSRIELPFDAEIAVRFKAGGAEDEGGAIEAEEVEDWALEILNKASATRAKSTRTRTFIVV